MRSAVLVAQRVSDAVAHAQREGTEGAWVAAQAEVRELMLVCEAAASMSRSPRVLP